MSEAASKAIWEEMADRDNGGHVHAGIVGIDSDGNVVMPFNTEGMFRGYIDENGKACVAIWHDK